MRMRELFSRARDWFRASGWLGFALLASLWLAQYAPQKVGVLIWLQAKLCWGAWLGYFVDRTMFRRARPHQLTETALWVAWCRRAAIVSACILMMGLGI